MWNYYFPDWLIDVRNDRRSFIVHLMKLCFSTCWHTSKFNGDYTYAMGRSNIPWYRPVSYRHLFISGIASYIAPTLFKSPGAIIYLVRPQFFIYSQSLTCIETNYTLAWTYLNLLEFDRVWKEETGNPLCNLSLRLDFNLTDFYEMYFRFKTIPDLECRIQI